MNFEKNAPVGIIPYCDGFTDGSFKVTSDNFSVLEAQND
jgi:hypothetical protein